MSETAHEVAAEVAANAAGDVAAQASAHGPTASEYIQHHLHHLQMDFSLNSAQQHGLVDFSLFNLDSELVSTAWIFSTCSLLISVPLLSYLLN